MRRSLAPRRRAPVRPSARPPAVRGCASPTGRVPQTAGRYKDHGRRSEPGLLLVEAHQAPLLARYPPRDPRKTEHDSLAQPVRGVQTGPRGRRPRCHARAQRRSSRSGRSPKPSSAPQPQRLKLRVITHLRKLLPFVNYSLMEWDRTVSVHHPKVQQI